MNSNQTQGLNTGVQPSTQYPNFLVEAVETSANGQQVTQKIDDFLKYAKFHNQIPDLRLLLSSICTLIAKYTDPGVRRA